MNENVFNEEVEFYYKKGHRYYFRSKDNKYSFDLIDPIVIQFKKGNKYIISVEYHK